MHLRRALLLFAIVLGLAAIAASVSRPRDDSNRSDRSQAPPASTQEGPRAAPAPTGSPATTELTFSVADPRAQRIRAGQAATVYVEVDEPGQVEVQDLGMSANAEPLTPARLDVLTSTAGRYPIWFVPAGAEDARVKAGTLVVAAAE